MTHPFDLLSGELKVADGLDEETFDRLATRLERHIAGSPPAAPARSDRRQPHPPRRLARVAAIVFAVAVASTAVVIGVTRGGHMSKKPPAPLRRHRQPAPLPLSAWVIMMSTKAAGNAAVEAITGAGPGPFRALDAATGAPVALGLPPATSMEYLPLSDDAGVMLGLEYPASPGGSVLQQSLLVLRPGASAGPLVVRPPSGSWPAARLSADGTAVWTSSDPGGGATCRIQELTLAGHARSPAGAIPCARIGRPPATSAPPAILAGLGGGVLLAIADSGGVEYWDPLRGQLFTIDPEGSFVATLGGRYVVWQTAGGCPGREPCPSWTPRTYATDVVTMAEQPMVTTLPALDQLLATAYSPASAEEALVVGRGSAGAAQLLIEDPFTGSVLSERPVTVAANTVLVWSADGRYLFVQRDATHVMACPAWSSTAPATVVEIPRGYRELWILRRD